MSPAPAGALPESGAPLPGGLRRAKIKIPVPVPPTNAWFLGDGEVTVIDCGPKFGDALDRLRAPLAKGERVERLLVTHGHPDHHGAAGAFSKETGCAVACHPFDATSVREYHRMLALRFAKWSAAARENGMPASLIAPMAGHYKALDAMGDDVADVEPLEGGGTVEAGPFSLEVLHLPGHTAGSVAFLDRKALLLFSGDSVLPGITPNPFFNGLFDEASGPAPFLASVERLRKLPPVRVLPGHGEPLDDLHGVLDAYERHHALRRAAIMRVLKARGQATGFALVEALFPGAGRLDRWLAIAEVLGHLQHLEALGQAERVSKPAGGLAWRPAP